MDGSLTEDLLLNTEENMEKSVNHLSKDLNGLRSGKASPSLVDGIQVDAYGSTTRLKDLAGINAPEPRMLVIQPWDASIIDDIVKAIGKANIGITPLKDGKIIRIPIPELSEERRAELKKQARKLAEDARVGVRNVRRDSNDKLKKFEKSSDITEDDKRDAEKEVQTLTDKYIGKIDLLLKEKEDELETV